MTNPQPPARWLVAGAVAIAVLVAATAVGGIFLPSTYAHETATWGAQGIGQDWVNLLVVVPALAVCAAMVARGSRTGELLLGGALLYLTYSYALYTFDVHFNALFLLYCMVLGLSFWMLVGTVIRSVLAGGDPLPARAPVRLAGGVLIAQGVAFYLLWLSEDVPALLAGQAPASLAEVGLPTNAVHVLDMAIVLPAMIAAGVALLRRRALGATAAAVMLSFAVLMAVAIGGMVVVMQLRRIGSSLGPAVAMAIAATVSAAVLVRLLRCLAGRGVVNDGAHERVGNL